ncbi:porin [Bermanella sp. R86510]|uniref:porin n=1 Tax=unclassified Bermanella TaxID=2627862 RepID=UPI0037CB27D4
MFKKTSLALAVTGLAFAGQSIAAPSVNVSGFVDMGLEYYSGDGTGLIFNGYNSPAQGNSDEQNIAMNNPVTSRLIVSGSEEHDNGWTTGYHIETQIDVLDDDAANGTAPVTTRQANITLSKDKHNIKVGSQWSPLFEYSAWNAMKTEGHGYGAYYFTTADLPGSLAYGFRNDSTINYTYGGGGYSTDPVTFTVAAHIGEGDATNEEALSGMTAGGAVSFGQVTVNGTYIKAMTTSADEPSLMSVGAKYRANDQLELGFNYHSVDKDDVAGDKRTSMAFGGMYNVTPDLSVHAGFGAGEDDNGEELESNIYAQVIQSVSDTFHIRLELEQVSAKTFKDTNNDGTEDSIVSGDDTVAVVYLRQAF